MQNIIQKYLKKNVPEIHTGDTIKVHLKVKEGEKERIQIFEGLVIATKHGKGIDGTFTVRKESYGVGVERVFPLHSPRIMKIERIKQSKVKRSKLYYMRELKGKEARLKELNRDSMHWEEPDAEAEEARIAAEKAAEAIKHAKEKVAVEEKLEAQAKAAAGDRVKDDKKEVKEEKVKPVVEKKNLKVKKDK